MDSKITPDPKLSDPTGQEPKQPASASKSDVTMIATTLGGAAVANLIFPGIGGALVGAFIGAMIGRNAAKEERDGD